MTATSSPRRADIASFFTCQHPDQFRINWRAFYAEAERRTDAVRARWPHTLDIAYGNHPSQRLDVYSPPGVTNAPVLLFLHGGGFREGDPALYGYLAEAYLQRRVVFGSIGYRLTPDAYLPDTVRDVEEALAWCAATIGTFGGNPERVFLAGHSAGAILTAHVSVRRDWLSRRGLSTELIKGAVPISGRYDFRDGAEFIADAARRVEASPVLNIAASPAHTIVAYGSLENSPSYGQDSSTLVNKLQARGSSAELLALEGMDHADTANAFGDARSSLFQAVERMLTS
jgi:arylformamidase